MIKKADRKFDMIELRKAKHRLFEAFIAMRGVSSH